MTRAPCRRRTGEAVPRAEKFGDLINSRSQSPQRRKWISNQSSVRSRGSRSCHSMDTILSVQNGNFSGNGKEFTEISWAVGKGESHLHWQFVGIYLWRFIMESSYFHTSLIRDEWDCRKSSAQSKGRHLCCIVAIRLGWKLVGWFYGILLLSAKCSRPPGRRENSTWKAIRRTISRSGDSFWSNGWIFSDLCKNKKQVKAPPIFVRKSCQAYSSAVQWSLEEVGNEIFWSQTLRDWKTWTHQKSMLGDSMQRKCERPTLVKNIFPIADGTVKLSGGDKVLRNIHLNQGQLRPRRGTRKSSRRIRRVSTTTSRLIAGWWWRKKWIRVHFRELYLPSSRWTESQTVHAEFIPNSTTIHWRDQSVRLWMWCTDNTSLDAHTRTFSRGALLHVTARVAQGMRSSFESSQNHSFTGHVVVVVFLRLQSLLCFLHLTPHIQHQRPLQRYQLESDFTPVLIRSGMDSLADRLVRSQTQVMSPSSASINLPSRNMSFAQEYDATIAASEDLNLPRHSVASRAASIQQHDMFPPCQDQDQ